MQLHHEASAIRPGQGGRSAGDRPRLDPTRTGGASPGSAPAACRRRGGDGDQVTDEVAADPHPADAVAIAVDRGARRSRSPVTGHDHEQPAGPRRPCRQPHAVTALAGTVVHAARRHHREHAWVAAAEMARSPVTGFHAAVGERGGDTARSTVVTDRSTARNTSRHRSGSPSTAPRPATADRWHDSDGRIARSEA